MMGRPRQYGSAADRKRAQRARDRASAAHRLDAPGSPVVAVVDHADPVGALAEWSRKTLIVPDGHPPLELQAFAVDWLRSVDAPPVAPALHPDVERPGASVKRKEQNDYPLLA